MRTAHNFNRQKYLNQKGFTLVELLIVISLIIIITGSIVPSFNTYIENQGIKQAQESVKDDLRTIQNRALNGEKALEEIGGDKVNYWGVRFTPGASTYTYFISTDTSTCTAGGTLQDIRTSDLLPGEAVIRSPSLGIGCVFFSFANGDLTPLNIPSDRIIVGPSTGSGVCRRIQLVSNGLIEMESGNGCTP